jgi:glycosyltransferase involved in cell wall biosynthesis
MRAIVVHTLWEVMAGAERVAGIAAQTLRKINYEVTLVSPNNFDRELYKSHFGIDLSGYPLTLPPLMNLFEKDVSSYDKNWTLSRLRLMNAYKFFVSVPATKAAIGSRADLAWLDTNICKPVTYLKRIMGRPKIVQWIHVPAPKIEFLNRNLQLNRVPLKTLVRGVYNLVSTDENPFRYADAVIVASEHDANIVTGLWGHRPHVIYPPAQVELLGGRPFKRNPNLVMLGRLSRENSFEDGIEAAAISKSKPRVTIIGFASHRYGGDWEYISELRSGARRKGIELDLVSDADFDQLKRTLGSSMVAVYTRKKSNYGISLAEFMASGCPVIVHRSGAPYLEMICRGAYGLSYQDSAELADKIDMLMQSDAVWERYSVLSRERAQIYGVRAFESKVAELLREL